MLTITDLVVRYGDVAALDGIDLEVADSEVVCVLGPSGCGKSTLLRAIAGLEPPDRGTVAWDGHDLAPVPPHRRELGLMFQDHALFPHRDVIGNVVFGLRMQRRPAAQADRRARELLSLVGLGGYEHRRIAELSGGEQQRVALARALAPAPRLLMLDEPLGSLDRNLRDRLVLELRDAVRRVERHRAVRDPRSRRGVRDRRPGRGHACRPHRAGRHARRGLATPGQRVRGPLPRVQRDRRARPRARSRCDPTGSGSSPTARSPAS